MENVILFSFSKKGNKLAEKIMLTYPNARHINQYKEKKLRDWVSELFLQHHILIFIGASGIAVRGIAPYIQGKDKDPAVLVVDELGQFVIPLLSGHLGGANEYALMLSKILDATPVVTTATDINHVFAVDVWAKREKLFIHNVENIKYISSDLLGGKKIGLVSDYEIQALPEDITLELDKHVTSGLLISSSYRACFEHTLWLTPKTYVIGVGCRKGFDVEKFEMQLLEFLEKHKIPVDFIARITSIDLKKEEEAIVAFSRKYGIEFTTYSAETLRTVEGYFQYSEFVQSITGVDNVCERSARLDSGADESMIEKTALDGMTIAVCERSYIVENIK